MEAALIDSLGQSATSLLTSARFTDFKFRIADDAGELQALLSRLIDSALRRDIGNNKTSEATSASPPPAGSAAKISTFVHPTTEIIHEEEEDEEEQVISSRQE